MQLLIDSNSPLQYSTLARSNTPSTRSRSLNENSGFGAVFGRPGDSTFSSKQGLTRDTDFSSPTGMLGPSRTLPRRKLSASVHVRPSSTRPKAGQEKNKFDAELGRAANAGEQSSNEAPMLKKQKRDTPDMASAIDSSPLPAQPSSPLTSHVLLPPTMTMFSQGYKLALRDAVDMLTTSLLTRGRMREAHAVRELYLQSFKQFSKVELLDKLLRRGLDQFSSPPGDVNGDTELRDGKHYHAPTSENERVQYEWDRFIRCLNISRTPARTRNGRSSNSTDQDGDGGVRLSATASGNDLAILIPRRPSDQIVKNTVDTNGADDDNAPPSSQVRKTKIKSPSEGPVEGPMDGIGGHTDHQAPGEFDFNLKVESPAEVKLSTFPSARQENQSHPSAKDFIPLESDAADDISDMFADEEPQESSPALQEIQVEDTDDSPLERMNETEAAGAGFVRAAISDLDANMSHRTNNSTGAVIPSVYVIDSGEEDIGVSNNSDQPVVHKRPPEVGPAEDDDDNVDHMLKATTAESISSDDSLDDEEPLEETSAEDADIVDYMYRATDVESISSDEPMADEVYLEEALTGHDGNVDHTLKATSVESISSAEPVIEDIENNDNVDSRLKATDAVSISSDESIADEEFREDIQVEDENVDHRPKATNAVSISSDEPVDDEESLEEASAKDDNSINHKLKGTLRGGDDTDKDVAEDKSAEEGKSDQERSEEEESEQEKTKEDQSEREKSEKESAEGEQSEAVASEQATSEESANTSDRNFIDDTIDVDETSESDHSSTKASSVEQASIRPSNSQSQNLASNQGAATRKTKCQAGKSKQCKRKRKSAHSTDKPNGDRYRVSKPYPQSYGGLTVPLSAMSTLSTSNMGDTAKPISKPLTGPGRRQRGGRRRKRRSNNRKMHRIAGLDVEKGTLHGQPIAGFNGGGIDVSYSVTGNGDGGGMGGEASGSREKRYDNQAGKDEPSHQKQKHSGINQLMEMAESVHKRHEKERRKRAATMDDHAHEKHKNKHRAHNQEAGEDDPGHKKQKHSGISQPKEMVESARREHEKERRKRAATMDDHAHEKHKNKHRARGEEADEPKQKKRKDRDEERGEKVDGRTQKKYKHSHRERDEDADQREQKKRKDRNEKHDEEVAERTHKKHKHSHRNRDEDAVDPKQKGRKEENNITAEDEAHERPETQEEKHKRKEEKRKRKEERKPRRGEDRITAEDIEDVGLVLIEPERAFEEEKQARRERRETKRQRRREREERRMGGRSVSGGKPASPEL